MSVGYPDQSDASNLSERAAFLIGSVKIRKYSNYSVQFRFALSDFEKYGSGTVYSLLLTVEPLSVLSVRNESQS